MSERLCWLELILVDRVIVSDRLIRDGSRS